MANDKIVTLDMFDRVANLKLSSSVMYTCEETIQSYITFLKELKYLEEGVDFPVKERNAFLKMMKDTDVRQNHITENENGFLIDVYRYLDKVSVLDLLIKKKGQPITVEELKDYHHILLKGTSSDDLRTDYVRTNNDAFVGNYLADGTKRVDYLPIDYKDIPEALKLLTEYYNADEIRDINDILIRPFLFHSLVAGLQIFGDGNTRLARVLQSSKIWNLTKLYQTELVGKDDKCCLIMPALYLTGSYKMYRAQYREIIRDLVVENSDDIWNKWLKCNCYWAQDSLNLQSNNLKKLKKMIITHR